MPRSSSSTTASAKASSSRRSSSAGRLVVISPHCDDAVFGCAELLARRPGAVVVTVFAGRPPAGQPLTPWDARAGFGERDDVMTARRAEDRAALAVLRARPRWLSFRDAQYGGPLDARAVVDDLTDAIVASRPETVAIPLGLFHEDHRTTHEAALRVARRRPDIDWVLYADALYRRIPGLVERRLATLRDAGLTATPLPQRGRGHAALKRRAVRCYRSQLRALASPGMPGWGDAFARERYWRLQT
jgi:LmbE family N-acetylglucosaminyl deacetylase